MKDKSWSVIFKRNYFLRDFHSLKVWNKAHELALASYKRTALFPRAELYGLTSQIRRAAVSIAGNISEGCGKDSETDFGRYLQIAMGSASELQYYWLLARDLGYLNAQEYTQLEDNVSEIKKMLVSLIRKLTADS
jgi:four helix bundle protein